MQDGAVGPDGLRSTVLPPRRAEQHQRDVTGLEIHRQCTTTAAADNHVGLVLVVLGLGDCESGGEVFVGQSGIQNGMTVLHQKGRLYAAWDGLPAVKEKDEHGCILAAD